MCLRNTDFTWHWKKIHVFFSSPWGRTRTFASDFALHVALSARAWNVYPWQVQREKRHKIEENEKTKNEQMVKHHWELPEFNISRPLLNNCNGQWCTCFVSTAEFHLNPGGSGSEQRVWFYEASWRSRKNVVQSHCGFHPQPQGLAASIFAPLWGFPLNLSVASTNVRGISFQDQYKANVSNEERSLVATFLNRTDIKCSGCVWYKDATQNMQEYLQDLS